MIPNNNDNINERNVSSQKSLTTNDSDATPDLSSSTPTELNETSDTCIALLGLSCSDSLREVKWQNMYKELKFFKSREGHCNVPQKYDKNPKLGTWVCTQRKAHKRKQMKASPSMPYHHYYLLNEIGFIWKSPSIGGSKHDNEKWVTMYNQLKDFKTKFGHCSVPQNFPENPKLARWVHFQRVRYKDSERVQHKYLLKNKIKSLSLEMNRFQALEEIGFVWAEETSRFRPDEALWMKRFYELIDFKSQYGHFKVPYNKSDYTSLRNWAKKQRYNYKLSVEGKPSNLTEDRKSALKQIGFI